MLNMIRALGCGVLLSNQNDTLHLFPTFHRMHSMTLSQTLHRVYEDGIGDSQLIHDSYLTSTKKKMELKWY